MNIRGIMRNARVRMRDPRAQNPSDRTLLVLLSSTVQNLLTEANLRGGYWAVDETEITVGPNNTEYIVPVQGFGKPIEVRAVYPASASHHSHDVDFFTLGDLNFQDWNWTSYNAIDPLWGVPYGDQRVAFYRKQGNTYMRIAQGGPPAGTTYKIIYQVGTFGETMPLDEEVMLPEHSGLVEIRLALAALPHAEWFDDERANKDRRAELTLTLVEDAKIAYALFKSSVATMTASNQPTYRYLDSID